MIESAHGSAPAEAATASVRIYLPDERLQSFVTFYYFVEVSGALEDFLYPEWGNVRFPVRGSWSVWSLDDLSEMPSSGALFGPTDRAAKVVSRDGATAGFGLTPLGWQRLFQLPAVSFANRIIALENQLGVPGDAVRNRLARHGSDQDGVELFDSLLLDWLATRPPNSAFASAVDLALRARPATVDAFARGARVSERTLLRVCNEVFGFGPKRLLRRQRFLDTLGRIRITDAPRFTELMDGGYVDQSHFNHEFQEFMGLTPREYLSVPRPLMGQAALVQLQTGIPLSFALPPPPD